MWFNQSLDFAIYFNHNRTVLINTIHPGTFNLSLQVSDRVNRTAILTFTLMILPISSESKLTTYIALISVTFATLFLPLVYLLLYTHCKIKRNTLKAKQEEERKLLLFKPFADRKRAFATEEED